mgnify:CR=1 FL=1
MKCSKCPRQFCKEFVEPYIINEPWGRRKYYLHFFDFKIKLPCSYSSMLYKYVISEANIDTITCQRFSLKEIIEHALKKETINLEDYLKLIKIKSMLT